MAILVLPKRRRRGREFLGWYFDVTTEESIEMSADIAKDPIEDGRQLSDHRTKRPKKLRFKGFKTATTIHVDDQKAARLEDAFKQLEEIFDRDERIEVVSSFGTFPNMMISSISSSQTAGGGLVQNYTIAFEEVFVARFEEVVVAALVPKKKRISARSVEDIKASEDFFASIQTTDLTLEQKAQAGVETRLLGQSRALKEAEKEIAYQKEIDAFFESDRTDEEKALVRQELAKDPATAKFL